MKIKQNKTKTKTHLQQQNLAWYQSRGVKTPSDKSPEAFWRKPVSWKGCQCPGEKQTHWSGLVDGYPKPDDLDHRGGTLTWLSFSHLSQPDVFWWVDMTSQEISQFLVVERSQKNSEPPKACYIAKCTFGECFSFFALSWPDSNYLQKHLINSKWHGLCMSPTGTSFGRNFPEPYHISLVGLLLSWHYPTLVGKWETF